mmetsp:Transcript_12400/g.41219  ORF Transcript_12400/g.41219 Transcript_12400/m.41219 type:complete len:312 (+) Transcript_12400:918-1853(+)
MHPTWPQVESTPDSDLGCAGAGGRFLPPPVFASTAAAHATHTTSSVADSCCRSRTDLKKRSERTLPMSSLVNMRSARTSSRMFHFWSFSSPSSFLGMPLREGVVALDGVGAADWATAGESPPGSFFLGVTCGVSAGVFVPVPPAPPPESPPFAAATTASAARLACARIPPSSTTSTCSGFIFFISTLMSVSCDGTNSCFFGRKPPSNTITSVCFCDPVMSFTVPTRHLPSMSSFKTLPFGGTRVLGSCSSAMSRASLASVSNAFSSVVPSGSPAPSDAMVLSHFTNAFSVSLSSSSNNSTPTHSAVSFHSL